MFFYLYIVSGALVRHFSHKKRPKCSYIRALKVNFLKEKYDCVSTLDKKYEMRILRMRITMQEIRLDPVPSI